MREVQRRHQGLPWMHAVLHHDADSVFDAMHGAEVHGILLPNRKRRVIVLVLRMPRDYGLANGRKALLRVWDIPVHNAVEPVSDDQRLGQVQVQHGNHAVGLRHV